MKVIRVAAAAAVMQLELSAVMTAAGVFRVSLIGPEGRSVVYSASAADDAERVAAERLADADLFGAVVSFVCESGSETAVSCVIPDRI